MYLKHLKIGKGKMACVDQGKDSPRNFSIRPWTAIRTGEVRVVE